MKERAAVAPMPIRRSLVIGEENGGAGVRMGQGKRRGEHGGVILRGLGLEVSPKKGRVFGMRENSECCGI